MGAQRHQDLGLVLGGKDTLDQRLATAREGTRVRVPAAMATFELPRPGIGAMAVGVPTAVYLGYGIVDPSGLDGVGNLRVGSGHGPQPVVVARTVNGPLYCDNPTEHGMIGCPSA